MTQMDPWLFVSKRLELLTLPGGLAGPAVAFGGATFYRLTPGVYRWFELAADEYCRRPRSAAELAEIAAAMTRVNAFATARWTMEELDTAVPALPDVEPVPPL